MIIAATEWDMFENCTLIFTFFCIVDFFSILLRINTKMKGLCWLEYTRGIYLILLSGKPSIKTVTIEKKQKRTKVLFRYLWNVEVPVTKLIVYDARTILNSYKDIWKKKNTWQVHLLLQKYLNLLFYQPKRKNSSFW